MISESELLKYKKKYAKLIAVVGLNDIKNKIVKVNAEIDDPVFVNLLVEELYKRGARRVIVDWTYRPVLKTIFNNTHIDELSRVYDFESAYYKFEGKELCPSVRLESEDPFWSEGINPEKIAAHKIAHLKSRLPYKENLNRLEIPWCLAAIPSVSWAKRLFPKLSDKEALNKMWEKVIICCRLNGDPIKNWQKFNKEIKARAKWLDSLKIKTLHYTSKNGTDLIVGVNPYTRFCGGSHDSIGNPPFNPNMPAVETYTTPDRLITEGIAYASKPLCRDGQLIKDFSIRFHKGKIIEVKAKQGEKFLKQLVATDENSCYLGELALVPFSSPVNSTKILYYNTLFDENAACHFAFGSAINNSFLKPIQKLNDEELRKKGVNRSSIHIDFMVGTKDLNIVATTRDGKKVDIFKNGNWAK